MTTSVPVTTAEVCLRAMPRLVAVLCAALFLPTLAEAQIATSGNTVKVGFFNIQSGKGEPGLPGRSTPFADNSNCVDSTQPMNAWGIGFVQRELVEQIGNDASVVALGLAEAWTCATAENVRKVLGWKSKSETRNGLAMVARHGFSGTPTFLKLDTSGSTDLEPRHVAHAKVCLDVSCAETLDVFVAHLAASGASKYDVMYREIGQIATFMKTQAGSRPRVLLGDFNLYEEMGPDCGNSPWPTRILDQLRSAGYIDAWRAMHGKAIGYTGMVNRPLCGLRDGAPYKRVDYAWSLGAEVVSSRLFGVVPLGEPAPSDHYGLLAEYALGSAPPPSDVTRPVTAVSSPLEAATVSGVVTVTASATDNVAVARVEFLADGALIGTDTAAPYAVSWDTRPLTNATHSLQTRAYDEAGNFADSALRLVTVNNPVAPPPPPPASGITWLHAMKVTAAGTSLTKTGGCNGCGDAGAVTQQEVTTDGGYVEFTPSTGGRFFAGLSADRSESTTVTTIRYAFSFWPSGGWDVRENGVYRKEGRFVAGDVFRIAVESGAVVYYHNGKAVYRSAAAPALPLALDTTFYTTGASINRVTVNSGIVAAAPAPVAPNGAEVVLYANKATLVGGGWQLTPEVTAAGGAAIRYPDAGVAKARAALAAPPSYAELTFYAEAGREYRLWMRGRADRDYWGNDSVFVQFSGSVDESGAPIWRIGTTSSTTYVLEDGTSAGLKAWGWQDNGYGTLGAVVRFAKTGTQTIRIQNREDGLSIDQIVLSSGRYLVGAPGPTKSDTTILPQ